LAVIIKRLISRSPFQSPGVEGPICRICWIDVMPGAVHVVQPLVIAGIAGQASMMSSSGGQPLVVQKAGQFPSPAGSLARISKYPDDQLLYVEPPVLSHALV